jgi:tetratricopeptide (TPR) repeat protein
MPKVLSIFLFIILSVFIFSGCNPPDLEGALLHVKNERWDEALVLAEKVTNEYPDNSEGWYTLGYIYGKKDRIADMIKAYDKCQSIDKTHDEQIKAEKFDYYAKKFNAGAAKYNEYLKQEDPQSEEATAIMDQSIKSFEQSNLLNPNFRAVLLAAQGYSQINKKDEALNIYTDLIKNYPDSGSAWLNLGRFYYNNKEYEEAIPNFKKATEIDSSDSEPYVLLAQSYDFLDKKEEAVPYYKTAILLNEEDSAVSFNLGLLLYKLAISTKDEAQKNGYFEDAIKYFAISIQYNEDFLSSYQLKGNAELLLKKYEDAKETLEIGTEKFPEDYQMWNDLSICYALLNETGKAKEAEARAEALK